MDLAKLAEKQKRIKDWSDFLSREVHDREVRNRTEPVLKAYKNLVAQCWDEGELSSEDLARLHDLERQLVQLNEEARVTITPGIGGTSSGARPTTPRS